jgi:hypothetical protein
MWNSFWLKGTTSLNYTPDIHVVSHKPYNVHVTVYLGNIYVQFKVKADVPFMCILYSTFFTQHYMFRELFAPILRITTAAYSHRCVYLWKAEITIVSGGVELYFD